MINTIFHNIVNLPLIAVSKVIAELTNPNSKIGSAGYVIVVHVNFLALYQVAYPEERNTYVT